MQQTLILLKPDCVQRRLVGNITQRFEQKGLRLVALKLVTAMISLYLNVFVLIVQLFQKVPALKALAPTQSEPPFAVTQLVVLALFVLLTIIAAIRFRGKQRRMA